ncbi:MAG: hypothetical protein ABIP03_14490 [Aquihabitans sp.]
MSLPPSEHPEADEPMSMLWTAGRVATVLGFLVMVAFWAWIFAGGPKKVNPDRLGDRAFVTRTQERCKQMLVDLDKLPPGPSLKDATQRADVLDQATGVVTKTIDDIEADAPTSGGDAQSVRGWIKDWRVYLANRADYAKRLRTDPKARLLLDENKGGDPIDTGIEVFAQVNDMRECATPGDVG